MAVYFVFETQSDGTTGSAIPNSYANQGLAEQKYHEILSAAAVSQVAEHGALIIASDYSFIRQEVYKHTANNEAE